MCRSLTFSSRTISVVGRSLLGEREVSLCQLLHKMNLASHYTLWSLHQKFETYIFDNKATTHLSLEVNAQKKARFHTTLANNQDHDYRDTEKYRGNGNVVVPFHNTHEFGHECFKMENYFLSAISTTDPINIILATE